MENNLHKLIPKAKSMEYIVKCQERIPLAKRRNTYPLNLRG